MRELTTALAAAWGELCGTNPTVSPVFALDVLGTPCTLVVTEEALATARKALGDLVASGQLVPIELAAPGPNGPVPPATAAPKQPGSTGTKGRSAKRQTAPVVGRLTREQAVEIRAWAKKQGLKVNDRGRVPAAIVEQFNAAH